MNANLKRREVMKKHEATLIEMSKHEEGDMGVLFDKLVYMYNVHTGDIPAEGADNYFVPEGFDYEAFGKDYGDLVK